MADKITPEKRSAVMAKIGQKDTKPELLLRSALHQAGYRYRLHDRGLPGSPDIVMPKYKTVVFVHGCFWHQHSCRDGHMPKSRQDFWAEKFDRNMRRDRRNRRALNKIGWSVIVVWECQIKKEARKAMNRTSRLLSVKSKRL